MADGRDLPRSRRERVEDVFFVLFGLLLVPGLTFLFAIPFFVAGTLEDLGDVLSRVGALSTGAALVPLSVLCAMNARRGGVARWILSVGFAVMAVGILILGTAIGAELLNVSIDSELVGVAGAWISCNGVAVQILAAAWSTSRPVARLRQCAWVAIIAAAVASVSIMPVIFVYSHLSFDQSEFFTKTFAVGLVLTSCCAISIFLLRPRSHDVMEAAAPPTVSPDESAAAETPSLICPRCRYQVEFRAGDATCPECGLAFRCEIQS